MIAPRPLPYGPGLERPLDYCGPATPSSPFESPGLGYSAFARHYLRNHGCFLFLRVLRWFTSPSSPAHSMDSNVRNGCSHPLGFPIRKSPDHSLLAASRSLSQLIASFIAYLRQGIHTHALSSLTIKSTSHTNRRYFLRAYILVFNVCPSNIQFSKISTASAIRGATQAPQTAELLVGLGRIELPTSPLSGVRSSQLSYRPKASTLVELVGIEPATS